MEQSFRDDAESLCYAAWQLPFWNLILDQSAGFLPAAAAQRNPGARSSSTRSRAPSSSVTPRAPQTPMTPRRCGTGKRHVATPPVAASSPERPGALRFADETRSLDQHRFWTFMTYGESQADSLQICIHTCI
eukprot:s4886_g2.t1